MKGKILCPAGCQNPVARITKAKEILKNPRPAGSWRPLKCIFSGKGKSRSQRAAKPRSGVILAKGKKAAHSGPQALSCPFYVRKNQTGAVCGSLRARFYHGAKIRISAVLPPLVNLVGECLPQTLLMRPVGRERRSTLEEKIQHAPPLPCGQNPHDRGRIRRLYRAAETL